MHFPIRRPPYQETLIFARLMLLLLLQLEGSISWLKNIILLPAIQILLSFLGPFDHTLPLSSPCYLRLFSMVQCLLYRLTSSCLLRGCHLQIYFTNFRCVRPSQIISTRLTDICCACNHNPFLPLLMPLTQCPLFPLLFPWIAISLTIRTLISAFDGMRKAVIMQ